MKVVLSRTEPTTWRGDALVLGVTSTTIEEKTLTHTLEECTGGLLSEAFRGNAFSAKEGENLLFHAPHGLKVRKLLVVGLGTADEASTETMRRFCGTASRALLRTGVKTVGVIIPAGHAVPDGVQAGTEGFLVGPGGIDAHRTGKKRRPDAYRGEYASLTLLLPDRITAGMRSAVRRGEIVAEAMILTRRLTNEPGNLMTPARLATEARRAGRAAGVSVTVWGRPQIEERGFGGLLAVTAGSILPPRFIIMRYTPAGSSGKNAPLVLVGKGITFDSGGISIKPGKGMEEMKADMAGAAAVIGALSAIGQLKPRRPVIGVIPTCENMPSGSATRPGDVITAYGGTTIEVVNTDAEGRLILADALAWAREQKPSAIVDIATLTGSCVVSLGHVYAGLMASDEAWARTVRDTALAQGEKVWRLPMDPEYDDLIASDIADVRNTGTDHPGTITAAKLLEKFTGEVPWVHLDIAGTEWRKEAKPWIGAGPTAFGVRTFVALALR